MTTKKHKIIYVTHIIFLLDSTDLEEEKGTFAKNHNISYKVISTVREDRLNAMGIQKRKWLGGSAKRLFSIFHSS